MKLTEKKQEGRKRFIEMLASLEHDQWMEWSKAVSGEVSDERMARWIKLWVPYDLLSEEEKESDRKYARKICELMEKLADER